MTTKPILIPDEEVKAKFEEATQGQSVDQWRDKTLKSLNDLLTRNPVFYRNFGPYWWALKNELLKSGYDIGGDMEAAVLEWTDHGDGNLNIVAAVLWQDHRLETSLVNDNHHPLPVEDGFFEYILEDADMEAVIRFKLMEPRIASQRPRGASGRSPASEINEGVTIKKNKRQVLTGKKIEKKTKKFTLQDRYWFQSLPISVENKKGRSRSGVDPDGNKWSVKMLYDYGYIRGSEASDGEGVDCFVNKPGRKSPLVFVVHQHKIEEVKKRYKDGKCPKCGETHDKCPHYYDEDKVMLGFSSREAAVKAYLKHYDTPLVLGLVSTYNIQEFKKALEKSFGRKLPLKEIAEEIVEAVGGAKWIGVDLDGTLAVYHGWDGGKIGEPLKKMVERVKKWIKQGKKVKIMTARAVDKSQPPKIKDWLEDNGLPRLDVTNVKDPDMIRLYDDRAVQVRTNTGEIVEGVEPLQIELFEGLEEILEEVSELTLVCSNKDEALFLWENCYN